LRLTGKSEHTRIVKKQAETKRQADTFAATYPNIAALVLGGGWIELGRTEYSSSLVRALDTGGMIWEGKTQYKSIDAALRALDRGIKIWETKHA
jgi:hypothetical protein